MTPAASAAGRGRGCATAARSPRRPASPVPAAPASAAARPRRRTGRRCRRRRAGCTRGSRRAPRRTTAGPRCPRRRGRAAARPARRPPAPPAGRGPPARGLRRGRDGARAGRSRPWGRLPHVATRAPYLNAAPAASGAAPPPRGADRPPERHAVPRQRALPPVPPDPRARQTGRMSGSLFRASAGYEIHKVVVGPLDNNVYVLRCTQTGEAVLLDAANEHDRLLDLCRRLGVRSVLETHGHWDHIQAVPELRDAGYEVHVTAEDADMLPSYDQILEDESVVRVGRLRLRTIHTPG